jgi:hypothetical protein
MQIAAAIQGHRQAAMATMQIIDPTIPAQKLAYFQLFKAGGAIEHSKQTNHKGRSGAQRLRTANCYNGSLQV